MGKTDNITFLCDEILQYEKIQEFSLDKMAIFGKK